MDSILKPEGRLFKASDIPDQIIYDLVDASPYPRLGQDLSTIEDHLKAFPKKIVLAKLAQMINKKRFLGCACGCRWDFLRVPGREK